MLLLARANLLAHPGCYALEFAGTKYVDCRTNSSLNSTGTFTMPDARVFPTTFSAHQWEKVAVNELAEASYGYNLYCGCYAILNGCFSVNFTSGEPTHQAMSNFN